MKVLVLYRPNSEHSRLVDEFIHNYQTSGSSSKLEVLNIDTRDGTSVASLYDITSYPAIMVLRDDGIMQNLWQGGELPRVNDVEGYL